MRRLAALALLLLATAAQAQSPFDEPLPNPTVWPACAAGQIEVMLLGTVHMANPGNDVQNVDVPDVRTAQRQAELDTLVARLAPYAPDKVMIEWVWGAESARADSAYAAYRAAGGQADSREEVDQVAFRLAHRLGHDAIYPIDYARPMDTSAMRNWAVAGGRTIHTLDYNRLVPERLRVRPDSLIRSTTLTEYHAWLNEDAALRGNHFGMFAGALGAGSEDAYPGPDLLTAWYGRNMNMVHHILRQVEPGDERVFVLVGAGHVRAMRHLLDEAPHFCPVSPLPYLQ